MRSSLYKAIRLLAAACFAMHASDARAGVEQAGIGPKAVQAFGLEKPEARPELQPGKMNLANPFAGLNIPAGSLLDVKGGRVQLFSVSRLSDEDMRNPFEIRVQVAVEMRETLFEIGGIVEGKSAGENTVILLLAPPRTNEPVTEEARQAEAHAGASAQPPKKNEQQKASVVCSVGDVVQGFRIHAIDRNGIIVEQTGKYVQIPRGEPVTICVPLTVR